MNKWCSYLFICFLIITQFKTSWFSAFRQCYCYGGVIAVLAVQVILFFFKIDARCSIPYLLKCDLHIFIFSCTAYLYKSRKLNIMLCIKEPEKSFTDSLRICGLVWGLGLGDAVQGQQGETWARGQSAGPNLTTPSSQQAWTLARRPDKWNFHKETDVSGSKTNRPETHREQSRDKGRRALDRRYSLFFLCPRVLRWVIQKS